MSEVLFYPGEPRGGWEAYAKKYYTTFVDEQTTVELANLLARVDHDMNSGSMDWIRETYEWFGPMLEDFPKEHLHELRDKYLPEQEKYNPHANWPRIREIVEAEIARRGL